MSPQPEWNSKLLLFAWPHINKHSLLDEIERKCKFDSIKMPSFDDKMKEWCYPSPGEEQVDVEENESQRHKFQVIQPVVFSRDLYQIVETPVRQTDYERLHRHRQLNDDLIDFWMAW